MLFIVLTFSFTAFAKEADGDTKDDFFNPLYWFIGIGVLVVIIVVVNLISYYTRTGMYGDIKKDEKKPVTINKDDVEGKKHNTKKKAKPKKKESFLDSDVKTILAGNRTIEIDKETCLVNNRKK